MSYSDEPVLVRPTRRPVRLWLAIGAVALLLASLAYIPWHKHRLEELAHDATRGPRSGASYPVTLAGQPHQIELGWVQGPSFAIGLTPPPPAGATLQLRSRPGNETLAWNDELQAFGPGTARINPYNHYKLKLTLLDANGARLWSDSLWALGVHDTHGHNH